MELVDRAQKGEAFLHLTTVNLGEVVYRLMNSRGESSAAQAIGLIQTWPISIHAVDQELALSAARVKATLKMGYLDCFVVALAQRLDATVVTGDPDYQAVEHLVNIEWLENNVRR